MNIRNAILSQLVIIVERANHIAKSDNKFEQLKIAETLQSLCKALVTMTMEQAQGKIEW